MPLSRYVCIGLVSAAALLFQVAQTRLFSASYGYHLTYLVISVSLLGVGSGATLSGLFDRRLRRPSLSSLALAAGASALAALFLETHLDPGVALAPAERSREATGVRHKRHPSGDALGPTRPSRRHSLRGTSGRGVVSQLHRPRVRGSTAGRGLHAPGPNRRDSDSRRLRRPQRPSR